MTRWPVAPDSVRVRGSIATAHRVPAVQHMNLKKGKKGDTSDLAPEATERLEPQDASHPHGEGRYASAGAPVSDHFVLPDAEYDDNGVPSRTGRRVRRSEG